MRILRLQVENFGTLQSLTLDFESGMNVLYHQNGWGKSTLAVFIKAMLYGLPASSKRSLDENERKKYTPWQGGAFGGSLEIETDRGRFRVERFFGAKESGDRFALFDLATNKPSTVYTQAIGEELFGIDAEGFERSTYLSQRALSGSKDNNSIAAKLGNLLDDVGDIGNYDAAIAALDKRRRHYVMTGNRGAIAELEETRLSLTAELERCRRLEAPMQAQEAEYSNCKEELGAVRRAAEEARQRIARAGIARERAVLLEQKEHMLEEISLLRNAAVRIDAFLGDPAPTAEELAVRRSGLEQMREVRTRIQATAARREDAERLQQLREQYKQGVPSAEALARLTEENEQLNALLVRYETLQETLAAEGQGAGLVKGLPTRETLERVSESLKRAASLRNAATAEPEKPLRGWQIPVAMGVLCVGVLLSVLSLMPNLASAMPALLAAGLLYVVGGGVWTALAWSFYARQKRTREACLHNRDRLLQEAQATERQVQAFLQGYGMTDPDLSRAHAALSVLCEQSRANRQRDQHTQAEMERLAGRCEQLSARLRAYLLPYFEGLESKTDYREELDRLRRESEELLRMEREARQCQIVREREQERYKALQSEWHAFAVRYDPDCRMTPAECFEQISLQMRERERLSRELSQKESALKAFLTDKRLDAVEVSDINTDVAALEREEKLLQAKLGELERRQVTLRGGIERLAQEVDRIPELEGELARVGQFIREAKANAATVANTAAFLEEAKTALSTRYLDGMQESLRRYLSVLCEADATEALMDTSFEVRLREGGQTRTMESFSRGWRDAVELCVRLSLTDALYTEGEKPFLLLDDPLVNLDDTRLAAARRLLERVSERYQILYLVCHKDRV